MYEKLQFKVIHAIKCGPTNSFHAIVIIEEKIIEELVLYILYNLDFDVTYYRDGFALANGGIQRNE